MVLRPKRTDVLVHSLDSVSLEKAKEQLRILDNDEDDLIASYIQAATCDLEEWTGYDLMPATTLAVFNWCGSCRPVFLLSGRPFREITKVEVWQDGAYVELATTDYVISQKTWETLVCINTDVDIEVTVTDGCPDTTEPVKITYETGKVREVDVTSITTTTPGSPNLATAILDGVHDLKLYDQVILSATGKDEYNGTFTAVPTGPTTFTFTYIGSDPGAVATGLCTIPEIPPQLKLAVMMMVAAMYENRGDCADNCGKVPCKAHKMAGRYRRYNFKSTGVPYDCCCR